MKSFILRILFLLTAVIVIVATTAFAPFVFALQIIAGAWRGFRYASYIIRNMYASTIRNFLEGWNSL